MVFFFNIVQLSFYRLSHIVQNSEIKIIFISKTPLMSRHLYLTITLLTIYGATLHAQQLKPDEFAALIKYKLEKIDSFMMAKGFKKQVFADEPEYRIVGYTAATITDSGTAQRTLHVGWQSKLKVLDLDYGLWLKSEATTFCKQLTLAGYKRAVTSIPDLDGKSSTKYISYKKGAITIKYSEKEQDSGTVYIFSIEDER